MHGSKSFILAIVQKGPRLPFPVRVALNNPSQDVLGSYEFLAMLEVKIRETPFFKDKSGRITLSA